MLHMSLIAYYDFGSCLAASYLRGIQKYAEFNVFFIVYSYNESTFQRNVHQGRCTSPGGASILLSHFCSNLLTIL